MLFTLLFQCESELQVFLNNRRLFQEISKCFQKLLQKQLSTASQEHVETKRSHCYILGDVTQFRGETCVQLPFPPSSSNCQTWVPQEIKLTHTYTCTSLTTTPSYQVGHCWTYHWPVPEVARQPNWANARRPVPAPTSRLRSACEQLLRCVFRISRKVEFPRIEGSLWTSSLAPSTSGGRFPDLRVEDPFCRWLLQVERRPQECPKLKIAGKWWIIIIWRRECFWCFGALTEVRFSQIFQGFHVLRPSSTCATSISTYLHLSLDIFPLVIEQFKT